MTTPVPTPPAIVPPSSEHTIAAAVHTEETRPMQPPAAIMDAAPHLTQIQGETALAAPAVQAIPTPAFRSALALLTGAVTLITTDGPAGRAGFTASAVCSVSDTPPTILVCMRTQAASNPVFRRNGVLCVNVLTPAQQTLATSFANPALQAEERFSQADWNVLASGAPVLHDALVSLDCKIAETHTVGTHDVCFCHVLGVRANQDGHGLVYFNRSYHQINHYSVLAS